MIGCWRIVGCMEAKSASCPCFPLGKMKRRKRYRRWANALQSVEDQGSSLVVMQEIDRSFDAESCDALFRRWFLQRSEGPLDALTLWYKTMSQYTQFTPEEERRKFHELERIWPLNERESGSALVPQSAQPLWDECILRNLRMVAWVCMQYRKRGQDSAANC